MKENLKKAMKIAGLTCLTLGSTALVASAAAVNSTAAGFRHLHDSVHKILKAEHDSAAE